MKKSEDLPRTINELRYKRAIVAIKIMAVRESITEDFRELTDPQQIINRLMSKTSTISNGIDIGKSLFFKIKNLFLTKSDPNMKSDSCL